MTAGSWRRRAALTVTLAIVYYAAARLGLLLASLNAQASAVWPPTGIAIAAFLLAGPSAGLGIWLGAFAANVAVSGGFGTSLAIATGNMLEGWLGAWAANRWAGGRFGLREPGGLLVFALVTCAGAKLVSPSIGVTSLLLGGLVDRPAFGGVWLTWWLGDASGALLFAPAILYWEADRSMGRFRGRGLEAAVLTLALAAVGEFGFWAWRAGLPPTAPLSFVCLPVLLWVAYRFGPRETATAVALLTLVSVAGALRGFGSFGVLPVSTALPLLQAFMAVIGLSALVLATLVDRQRRDLDRTAAGAEQQADLLQTVLDGMNEGVLVADLAGRFLRLNGEARRILGLDLPAGQLDRVALERTYRPGTVRTFRADGVTPYGEDETPDRRAIRGETVIGEQVLVVTPSRPKGVWLEVSSRLLRDERGGNHRVVSVFRDVTARRQIEAKFRGLLEAAPDAMVIVDHAGTVTLVNRQAERLFGYERDEMLGRPVEFLLPDRFRVGHSGHRQGFFRAPHTRPMGAGLELFALRRDGTEFPCEISLAPLETEEGVLVTAAIRDITERRRAEEELRRRTEMDEALLRAQDDLGEGVAVVDATTGRYLRVNASLCRMYGYTEAEMLALGSTLDTVDPAEREVLRDRMRRRFAGEPQADHYETTGIHRDGRRIRLEVAVKTLDRPGGKVMMAIVRDITERRRLDELERQKNMAEAANRAKSRFLATVSHELRTPLTAIIGFAGLLLRDAEDGAGTEARPYLTRIHENGCALLAEINDLLDLAKIEAGRMAPVRSVVDLAPFLREVASAFELQARQKGVELLVEVGAGLPALETDGPKLRRILSNLVANAVKFTDRGRVTVRADVEPGAVRIAVRDTGIGIPPDKLELIFEPFEQADAGNARRFEGTGLGLAICRSLADLLGYAITVESRPGEGTVFTIRIPVGADAKAVRGAISAGGRRDG